MFERNVCISAMVSSRFPVSSGITGGFSNALHRARLFASSNKAPHTSSKQFLFTIWFLFLTALASTPAYYRMFTEFAPWD